MKLMTCVITIWIFKLTILDSIVIQRRMWFVKKNDVSCSDDKNDLQVRFHIFCLQKDIWDGDAN